LIRHTCLETSATERKAVSFFFFDQSRKNETVVRQVGFRWRCSKVHGQIWVTVHTGKAGQSVTEIGENFKFAVRNGRQEKLWYALFPLVTPWTSLC
jgi:hypothetical protein